MGGNLIELMDDRGCLQDNLLSSELDYFATPSLNNFDFLQEATCFFDS